MKETILVIGLGSMGQRRIRMLRSLYPGCKIIGMDNNQGRAEKVRQEYEIDLCHDLADIQASIYAAFICTSPESHHKLIRMCLLNDCHVFTEINLLDKDYEENMKLANMQNKTLFLSSTQLYKDEIQHILRQTRKNKDKKIYIYHVGQYLSDWHPWDQLSEFFISKKATNGCRELMAIELPWIVTAFGRVVNTVVTKGNFTHLDIEFPDIYMIHLIHEDGSTGTIVIDVVSRKAVRKLEVYNENMYISWNGTPDSLIEQDVQSRQEQTVAFEDYIHDQRYGEFINEAAYLKEVEEFFAVVNGKKPIYDFAKDQEIIHLINAIEGAL